MGIWDAHRQYTLELYHFLTTDPVVPQALREELASLGLCRDENSETGHGSPQLYVREGRRRQGQYVLSQKDVLESPEKPDAIVVSSFPIDSHDCPRVALPEGGVINEGTIYPVRMNGRGHGYPYHVPDHCLLPREVECDNLLVPVALSSTHEAYSAHETRANAVPVALQSGSRIVSMTVDETKVLPSGEMFRRIGEVALEKDLESTITISNLKTVGFVIVDALQLLPLK